jgi:uncharacterized membrane protein YphA (DoxX/SURF4 family)
MDTGRDPRSRTSPARDARDRALSHAVARYTLAFVFAWHGIVPKLILEHRDEWQPFADAGVGEEAARSLVRAAGWAEIAFAALLVVLGRARWTLWLVVGLMPALTIALAVTSPWIFRAAFQPLTLNLCAGALAWIALRTDPRRSSSG